MLKGMKAGRRADSLDGGLQKGGVAEARRHRRALHD